MAVDKLVDSNQLNSDLTSVANAIRTKGGTSASLNFPSEFVSAIAAIPSGGGGITPTGTKTINITSSGTVSENVYTFATVNVNVPAGTEGTPTASKGTVTNHSVTVTPSVTNSGGFISGTTKTGTAVTVTASELVSGAKSITANGNGQNVANYATVNVNVPNSYGASDEGKVVSGGNLVAQTVATYNANGTYNTTTINSVTVNVSGGGGGFPDYIEKLMNAESFAYENNTITRVKAGALQGGAKNLTSLKIPNCTFLEANCLSGIGCTVLALPALTGVDGYNHLSGGKLQTLDLGSNFSQFKNMMIQNNYDLSILILRNSSAVTLDNINQLNSNAFKSGGTGGVLIVPQGTISLYQQATNWSTILGYANNQIMALENSPFATQYADGTPIT